MRRVALLGSGETRVGRDEGRCFDDASSLVREGGGASYGRDAAGGAASFGSASFSRRRRSRGGAREGSPTRVVRLVFVLDVFGKARFRERGGALPGKPRRILARPSLVLVLVLLGDEMAPPRRAAICAGGGAGTAPLGAPRRAFPETPRERGARSRRPPGVPSASRRPAFRARRGKRRLPGCDRADGAREGGGRAHRRADEPGTSFSLSFHHFLSVSSSAIVVRSGRGSSGSLSFAPGFVARRRRSGVGSSAAPILVGRGSLRSVGTTDARRRRVRDDALGGFERAFRELPDLRNVREIQKRRPCLGAVRRRVPPPPPRRVRESSSRASMEPSESYQTTVDADTFHPRAPDPNDAAKVRPRRGLARPRRRLARRRPRRNGAPRSSPSPASASRDPDPSMPP